MVMRRGRAPVQLSESFADVQMFATGQQEGTNGALAAVLATMLHSFEELGGKPAAIPIGLRLIRQHIST
jgi:hypothetical protein